MTWQECRRKRRAQSYPSMRGQRPGQKAGKFVEICYGMFEIELRGTSIFRSMNVMNIRISIKKNENEPKREYIWSVRLIYIYIYPEAPKTELNYDERIRPSLTPSNVITVIHAPITLFFAIDARFNIHSNGQIAHWTDG